MTTARARGKVIFVVSTYFSDSRNFILIIIQQQHRYYHQGVGNALVKAVEREARAKGEEVDDGLVAGDWMMILLLHD